MEQENHSKGIMHGKRGIVMGVANDRSIAWGIADAIAKQEKTSIKRWIYLCIHLPQLLKELQQ